MSQVQPTSLGRTAATLAALVAIAAVLILPSFLVRGIWHPDETRYAEVTRRLAQSPDHILPRLNGEPYPDKPPMFFWLAGVASACGAGVDGGRVVAALASAGTLLCTFALARLWLPVRVSFLAASVLATTPMFVWIGSQGVLDSLLAMFTTLAMFGFARYRARGCGLWVFFVATALAILTKGPVGLLVPVLGAAAWAIAIRGEAVHYVKPRQMLIGIAATLALIAAWVVPACILGGKDYADAILLHQNVGRMSESFAHEQPWHYYLRALPLAAFPWVLPLVPAIADAVRTKRHNREATALVLWIALALVAFTLISGKRERYLLPLFPAGSILAAAWLAEAARRALPYGVSVPAASQAAGWARTLLRIQHGTLALVGVVVVIGAFGVEIPGAASLGSDGVGVALSSDQRPYRWVGIAPAVAGIAACAFGLRAAARSHILHSTHACVVAMGMSLLAFYALFVPTLDKTRSPWPTARAIAAMKADAIALFRTDFEGSLHLTLGIERFEILQEADEVRRFLEGPGVRLVLTSRNRFEERLANPLGASVCVSFAGLLRGREVLMLSSSPVESSR